MHPQEALVAFGAGPSSGPADAVEKYLPSLKAWEERAAALGRPIGTVDDGPDSSHLRMLLQRTIREGYESETQDGRPASSLMGKRLGFDQGRMYLSFSPFTQLVATNDFAVLFLFTPRGTLHTDVDLYWLVDGKATEVDVEKMIWGWDETTKQDKVITENNQAGILSKRYRPGRYSEHERRVVTFHHWYLAQFGVSARPRAGLSTPGEPRCHRAEISGRHVDGASLSGLFVNAQRAAHPDADRGIARDRALPHPAAEGARFSVREAFQNDAVRPQFGRLLFQPFDHLVDGLLTSGAEIRCCWMH